MIASLTGTVSAVHLDNAVLSVNGVGFLVHATPAVLAGLRVGDVATVATSLIVREDALQLFGFSDDDEKSVFESLLSVSGVGPRLALASLAVFTPDALRRALADDDQAALTRIPGVGKKGAARMALELKDKLGAPTSAGPLERSAVAGGPAEVVDALVGLGWNVKIAQRAVDSVVEAEPDLDVPGTLRAALRTLGGSGKA